MADENDIKDANKQVMEAFNEFKATNDANNKKRDVLLDEKLAKINDTLDKFEPLNQQVTLLNDRTAAMQGQYDKIEAALNRPRPGADPHDKKEAREYRDAFMRVIRKPAGEGDPKDLELIAKRRATLVTSDDAGAGYLLAPPDVVAEIIKDVIEISPMRALATVRIIGGPSLKQPRRTGTAGATRVGERQNRVNTGDPKYGMLEITAPELFARAEVSLQMLEDAGYDLGQELREEFSEQFAVREGAEFVGGPGGTTQAEGFLVAAGVGEVLSGDATKITADGMIDLVYSLKSGYAKNARLVMQRLTIRDIRKLQDQQKQYLWAPGIAGAVPNTILGTQYVEFPDMPIVAAGNFPVAYGDFKRGYTIADRIAMSFQVDFTTGADDGIAVYRARKRVGGGTRQVDALKKLKIGTA